MQKYVKIADGVQQECRIKYLTIVPIVPIVLIVLTARDVVQRNLQKELVFSEPEVRHLQQQQPNGSSIVNTPHHVRLYVLGNSS
jgi:hypothetical protein